MRRNKMEFAPILEYLATLAPWAPTVLAILGSLVVILTIVDKVVPDEKDNGFMKKLLDIPVVGKLLKDLRRFSLFRAKKDDDKPKK